MAKEEGQASASMNTDPRWVGRGSPSVPRISIPHSLGPLRGHFRGPCCVLAIQGIPEDGHGGEDGVAVNGMEYGGE